MQPAPERVEPAWKSRMRDMNRLVSEFDPNAPVPWRVKPFVVAGSLAILAGKGGSGKTWAMHEAADAVQKGITKAGLAGTKGKSLLIDAEMGEYLTVKRFSDQKYATDIEVFDAIGMDLKDPKAREMVRDAVLDIKPDFLGFDSLRALVPSAKENDSDDMGPVVTWLRWLTRESGAAGILIHHAGWKEDRTRGSSAIKDQADAVWYMSQADDEGGRKLSCRGPDLKPPRWSEPPPDLFVRIGPHGGLQGGEAPVDKDVKMREDILHAVKNGTYVSGRSLAEAIGVNGTGNAFTKMLKSLRDEGTVEQGADKVFKLTDRPEAPQV